MASIPSVNSLYTQPVVAQKSSVSDTGWLQAFNRMSFMPPATVQSARLPVSEVLKHPVESFQVLTKLRNNPANPTETMGNRIAQFEAVKAVISKPYRKLLDAQLKAGLLTDSKSDTGKSRLAYLYSIVSTPRANGLNAGKIVEAILEHTSDTEAVSQKFSPLKPHIESALLSYYNSGKGPKLAQSVDLNLLRSISSATCVAASMESYAFEQDATELIRQIAEATSPQLCFYERVNAGDISPEDPNQATQIFNEMGIQASPIPGSNGSAFWVKVDVPPSGLLRAINQQESYVSPMDAKAKNLSHTVGQQNVVDSIYQGALTHLVAPTYDPGLDMRINPDGSLDTNKGLQEYEKRTLEAVMKDKGGIMSVTYQFTAAGRDNEPYLMGYFRGFDKTLQDLMQGVDMGGDVQIGIVDTDTYDAIGRLDMKHELRIKAYHRDPQTGEVQFQLTDSDDNIEKAIWRPAREIVPMLHHATFPAKLAQRIWSEINGSLKENQYLLPDQADAQKYNIIPTVPAEKQQAFLDDFQKMVQEQEAQANGGQAPVPNPQPAPQPAAPFVYQPVFEQPVYASMPLQLPGFANYLGQYNTKPVQTVDPNRPLPLNVYHQAFTQVQRQTNPNIALSSQDLSRMALESMNGQSLSLSA